MAVARQGVMGVCGSRVWTLEFVAAIFVGQGRKGLY